jgi:uncharacterized protein (TIRG00374 family)
MKEAKKYLKNMILFVVLIAVTFYIVLKNQNIEDIKNALLSVDIKYLLVGVAAMFVYFGCEAFNLKRTLGVLGEKSSFIHCFRYVLIGFFFSAITPAASGGQPMQIYFMHKDKLSGAKSTLSLLILLCSYHIVTITFAIISFCFNVATLTVPMRIMFVFGIICSCTLFSLYLIGIFSKKTSRALIGFGVKVLKLFKVKNIDEKEKKLVNGLDKYHGGAEYIKSNPRMMIKTILITMLQMAAYYSISYWVYRSFGLSQNSLLSILTIQSILYISVCVLPLPGSVGVSEGVFLGLYAKIYSEGLVGTAMMLHRGISFYLFVIICSIAVMYSTMKHKKEIEQEMVDEKVIIEE